MGDKTVNLFQKFARIFVDYQNDLKREVLRSRSTISRIRSSKLGEWILFHPCILRNVHFYFNEIQSKVQLALLTQCVDSQRVETA